MLSTFWQWLQQLFGTEADQADEPNAASEAEALIGDASELSSLTVIETIDTSAMRSRGGSTHIDWSTVDNLVTISQPRFLWCLDNGHGSLQSGKRSPFFEGGGQLLEWSFNRDIVRRIVEKLDPLGVQFINIVPEDDVDAFLAERVSRANEIESPLGLPKIFVSIHANAMGVGGWDDRFEGLETWYHPNSADGAHIASVFQTALVRALPNWRDRGLKHHQSGSGKIFYVLRNTNMPAILTENGYYTHPQEAARLMTDDVRQQIADAHVAAILEIEQNGYENFPAYPKRTVIG